VEKSYEGQWEMDGPDVGLCLWLSSVRLVMLQIRQSNIHF
jgi:hypothetical protein